MGTPEIRAFLAHLATERNVAASTQNQALAALLFLYREVLHQDLDPLDLNAIRAKKPKRLPTVLTRAEAQKVLALLTGQHLLMARHSMARHSMTRHSMARHGMARLLYGSGLRLMECLRLRVKACPELAEGMWISNSAKSPCATAKGDRIASRCCPRPSSPPCKNT